MKKIILLLTLVVFTFCCKDKNDPEPGLSSRVQGNYKATKLRVDGTNLPLTERRSMTLVLFKTTTNEVNRIMEYLTADGDSEADDLGDVTLKDNSENGIDRFDGSEKVGNWSKDNILTVTVIDEGSEIEIIAGKK